MFGFLKKLFGKGEIDNILNTIGEDADRSYAKGIRIAEGCYENGLMKGEIVKLSELNQFISRNYAYNSRIVQGGFLAGMKSYVDQGVVVSLNMEGGDIVFVHEDHVNDFLGCGER